MVFRFNVARLPVLFSRLRLPLPFPAECVLQLIPCPTDAKCMLDLPTADAADACGWRRQASGERHAK